MSAEKAIPDNAARSLRVAVTGASGCIGRALVSQLHATMPDVTIRALLRGRPGTEAAALLDCCEIVNGDLRDRRVLARLVRGADIVYHCAATMNKADREQSHRVNVEGTENLALASLDAGVRRFVYISSISVFAATHAGNHIITEGTAPENIHRLNDYSRTKLEAERRLQHLLDNRTEWTIVRPTNVYGPWSRPWFSYWTEMLRRTRHIVGNVQIDVVHCDDVANALIACGLSGTAANDVFHVSHESLPLVNFVARVAAVVRRPVRKLPPMLDLVLRRAIESGYKLATGRVMSLSLTRPVFYPHTKAVDTFGYAPRIGIDAGFASIAEWYDRQRT
jgi:nucleoside-diphosphate-sugar epimerase